MRRLLNSKQSERDSGAPALRAIKGRMVATVCTKVSIFFFPFCFFCFFGAHQSCSTAHSSPSTYRVCANVLFFFQKKREIKHPLKESLFHVLTRAAANPVWRLLRLSKRVHLFLFFLSLSESNELQPRAFLKRGRKTTPRCPPRPIPPPLSLFHDEVAPGRKKEKGSAN